MASSTEYLAFVLEQLSGAGEISWKSMMGEYILYSEGRIFGGIYDDRLLIKDTPTARALMPNAPRELPYEGAKEMLLAEDVDDGESLCALVRAMTPELPPPRKR